MDVDKDEVFEYLDELRDSGVTNMFGATSYIRDKFWIEEKQARELLKEWMDSFSE